MDGAGPSRLPISRSAANRGCPEKGVVVTRDEVKIAEQVNFRTGKATIVRSSYRILNQVADVLQKFGSIRKVEVQGHTDDVGRRPTNLRLSQRRADAVRLYLVRRGVAPTRLVGKGYGPDEPLVRVDSEGMSKAELKSARAKNRRVQFVILERGEGE